VRYIPVVGSTRPEREYRQSRSAYLGAAYAVLRALADWEAARVPLLAGPDGELAPWTPHQIRTTLAAAEAMQQLVRKRKEFDAMSRAYGIAGFTPAASPSHQQPRPGRARPAP
jgi:hypothetical protein